MTDCNCEHPGWCERHGIRKTAHWHHLCKTNERYFNAWEKGCGPGQLTPKPVVAVGPRPRVGFITPTLNYGGAERWIATLANHIDSERYDIRGMAVMLADTVNVPVVPHVKVVDGKFAIEWLASQCDILIAWGMYSLQMLTWQYVKYQGHVAYSLQGHCDYTLKIVSTCDPQVTHYVPVSEDAAKSVPEGRPYTIIHNGVDTARLASTLSRDEARAAIGLHKDDIALGYVGRLSSEKDCLSCVLAAKQLGSPYRPVLIGGGVYSHYQLARARMIHPDFIHVPFTENIGDIYRALDVMFLTSPSEGFSHSLAEAWYCGIPTVCTPVGGVPELERQYGSVSVTVPIDHRTDQLARATLESLSPKNRKRVKRAKLIIERLFTEQCMVEQWQSLIDRLLGISRPLGLGDMVAAGLGKVGITKQRVSKVLRRPCNCGGRQRVLNQAGKRVGIGT
jgi:glycosyltransferase involved in cell wall biosynthesis